MATSFTVAGRNNGFTKVASVAAYGEAMAGFAAMGTLAIWYAHLDQDQVMTAVHRAATDASKTKKGTKARKKAKGAELAEKTAKQLIREQFRAYRATLRYDQRKLLERFQVVAGHRHYDWRQLRDVKGSVEVEAMGPVGLNFYAGICGWTLARAHARSGDPVAQRLFVRTANVWANWQLCARSALALGERLRRGHLDCEHAVDLHVAADRRSGWLKIRRWVKSVRSWVTT